MIKKMNFAIWGCGTRGKLLLSCIDKNRIKVFIDSNESLIGTYYKGIEIVSVESYLRNYADCFIIISPTVGIDNILKEIKRNDIKRYFELVRCPMELPSYGALLPFEEMLNGIKSIEKREKIVLAGLNVFTILLYEFLKEDYKNVFIADLKEERVLKTEIESSYPQYKFCLLDEYISNDERVLITDRYTDVRNDWRNRTVERFYRFTYLSRFKYRNLDRFKGIYRGKRCFIVGNGPSIKIDDLELLYANKEISFGVNNVYKAFDMTRWRPDIYIYSDTQIDVNRIKKIKKMDVKHIFLGNRNPVVGETLSNVVDSNIYLYPSLYEYYQSEGPSFSDDLNTGVFAGYTVLYDCIQFAVYMGFDKLFIIGADCGYKGRENSYFIKNYLDEIDSNPMLETKKVFLAYRKAKEYAEKHNIKIYNATRGGLLEVFERVDFDDLFPK